MHAHRRSMPGLLMLCAALALAGCGEPRGPEVATAKSPAATAGPAESPATAKAPAKESDYDKALRYTRCMTEHGEEMDDPVEGVALPFSGKNRSKTTAWIALPEAFHKCKHLMPATWPVKMDPKDLARERPFVECLRKHGIDAPEPDANGMVRYPTDTSYQAEPEFEAAVAACRHLIDDPAVGAEQ